MKAWGVICLLSMGGLTEAMMANDKDGQIWGVIFGVSILGWSWSAISNLGQRLWSAVTGRRMPLPQTDPRALAAEMAALNAQIAHLRDTATSFDMSFDKTLECLDERLRRVEQQSAYAPPTVPLGRRP